MSSRWINLAAKVRQRLPNARPAWSLGGQQDGFYVLEGIRLPADERLISENIDRALRRGSYEHEERGNLPRLFQEGDVVLELGAGLGLVSTLCARDKRVRRVTTVEANPALIPCVREVHRLNGVTDRVDLIHAIALPDPSEDETDFFVRNDVWASSTNGDVWGWARKIRTRVMDLNALIEARDPSLLIVDIEGGEVDLFDGLEPGNLDRIYLELHGKVIGPAGVQRIFDTLSRLGFAYDPAHSARAIVTFRRL
jgi:FkbM family methyltransferase